MGSMQWTAEEARYLKAIFAWQDRFDDEQNGGARVRDATTEACAGDLRVLLVGAQGVGKTALLTRFCGHAFTGEPDERLTCGGRRPVRIDKLLYNMDVLEMPAQHLVETADGNDVEDNAARAAQSPAGMVLEQALAMTEAAIIVYDVRSPASFRQASCLYARLLRERRHEQQKREAEEEEQHQQLLGLRTSIKSRVQASQRSLRVRRHKRQKEQMTASQDGPCPTAPPHAPPPPRPFALLLVGNKSDVDDSERRVAWADGSMVAGPHGFLEASAKEDDKVDDVFVQIGREILKQRADAKTVQARAAMGRQETMGRASSSASSPKARPVLGLEMQKQTPRRPFLVRVLGLSFGRRGLNAPVAL